MPQIQIIGATKQRDAARLNLAAYCRVITHLDDQQNSYLAQIDRYTKLIGENPNWELHDIYADEGISGTRADRQDFQRMLKDCRKGLIDKIIVKSVSRFARNTRDCIATIRELKSLGISVYFEKENLDTEKLGGELFLSMYGTVAQEESISISGNMRWSYKKRMQEGRFITCSSFFGYRLVEGALVVAEDEARIVQRIYSDYLKGKGIQEISRELTQNGIKKLSGETSWHVDDISRILKNEKYAGDALLQKTYTTDTLPFRKVRNHGERTRYYIENSHPKIIEKDAYNVVQSLLDQRGRVARNAPPRQYLFSGVFKCGECGSAFKRRVIRDITYWRCSKHDRSKDECGVRQIVEDEVQAAFVRLWNTLQKDYHRILHPILNGLQELQDHTTRNNQSLFEINKAIAELGGQNIVLSELHTKGYMDTILYTEQVSEINSKLSTLRKQRRKILESAEDESIPQINTLIGIMAGADPIAEFDELCFESIIEKIIVESQEKIRFRLLGGVELAETIKRRER